MRFAIALLSVALLSTPVVAQSRVTLQVDFAEIAATSESAIESAFLTKAWTDSANIYFNAELAQRGPSNLVRTARRDGVFSNYRLFVQALPLMGERGPTGLTAYSLILFRAPSIGNTWQYVTSTVGVARNPRDAASEMLRLVAGTLSRR